MFYEMSTVTRIELALPELTAEELVRIERAVHEQYRRRGNLLIYDDAHGALSELDLIATADLAFQEYDKEEMDAANRKTR